MNVFTSKKELSKEILRLKKQNKNIGFVPTMGALHQGHIELIKKCKAENDICVVSIFVNPTQFNDKNDLKNYPRTLDEDLIKINDYCDLVFTPTENEIYETPDNRTFDFGNIAKVMEGKYREGHFNGVAQVVSKLFDIVAPNKAYFGKKDFQQLVIIKKLVEIENYKIEIVPCEIVREKSGLAMSSRNERLSEELRENAAEIYKFLKKSVELKSFLGPLQLTRFVINNINANPNLEVEYFEIVDDYSLEKVNHWKDAKNITGCIAVYTGNIRLIDNIKFK